MTAQNARDAWTRLGEMLENRRVEMDTRYSNRSLFAEERGIDPRLAYDVEKGARANYRRPTRRAIEVAYGWRAGSIERVLAGGEPLLVPQPNSSGRPDLDGPLRSIAEDPDLDPEVKAAMIEVALRLRERRQPGNGHEHRRHA